MGGEESIDDVRIRIRITHILPQQQKRKNIREATAHLHEHHEEHQSSIPNIGEDTGSGMSFSTIGKVHL